MDYRAIGPLWDKNFGLTPLRQTVVYRELQKIYTEIHKTVWKYPSVSIPLGADTEKSSTGGYPY